MSWKVAQVCAALNRGRPADFWLGVFHVNVSWYSCGVVVDTGAAKWLCTLLAAGQGTQGLGPVAVNGLARRIPMQSD